jgi:hypothetical protein
VLAHFITELLELVMSQGLRSYVDEIPLRGVAMLPIDRIARGLDESLQFAHRLRQHSSVVFPINHPVTPLVFFQQRRGEL